MAYHHFTDINAVTRTLAFFLKPGGSLIITDLMKPETQTEDDLFPWKFRHIVAHPNAFDEQSVRTVFEGAGLGAFTFTRAGSAKMHGKDVDFFLAKGTK
jgi:ubiquinone/menaquinone biosynthesis C-methylase UbiE